MSFELLRSGQVWIEHDSTYYRLHTTRNVSFNQTFKQGAPQKKTLHARKDLFKGSTIFEANPANFSFELFMVDETSTHQHKPLDLLLNYSGNTLDTFNMYFYMPTTSVDSDRTPSYYKVTNCVFTEGTFQIPTKGLMTVNLSGSGSELERFKNGSFLVDNNYDENPSFAVSKAYKVTVGSSELRGILGASLQVQNNITWTPNTTVQATRSTTNADNTTYPQNFTLTGRSLGGSIQQYVAGQTKNAPSSSNNQTWEQNTTIRIQAGLSSSNYQLDLNMPNACSFTNRTNVQEIFSQNYDYRLMTNPSDLNTYFTY